jgi:NADPH2:quinone reductase
VRGLTALVYGAAGGVGSIATQMAVRDGAQVIGVVRRPAQQATVPVFGAHEVFLADDPGLAAKIRKFAPGGSIASPRSISPGTSTSTQRS